MREQSLFVNQQQVVADVELVSLRKAEVGAEEIGHGAVEEPLAMQPPFASRRDEPVGRQHLQHVIPTCALAAFRQTLGPEAIEPQLAPQRACEPTRAPLTRPTEPHLAEPQPDHVVVEDLATILREQRERARLSLILVEHFDRPAPSFGLRGIDLAEVEHVALHHSAAVEPPALHDAPIEMRLSVLPPFGLSPEHGGEDFATPRRVGESTSSLVGLHYSRFWRCFQNSHQPIQVFTDRKNPKNRVFHRRIREVGLSRKAFR